MTTSSPKYDLRPIRAALTASNDEGTENAADGTPILVTVVQLAPLESSPTSTDPLPQRPAATGGEP
jgi:hypothetical protein